MYIAEQISALYLSSIPLDMFKINVEIHMARS